MPRMRGPTSCLYKMVVASAFNRAINRADSETDTSSISLSCSVGKNVYAFVSNVTSPPCSQLFQANHTVFGSSQGSSTEDLFTDSIDSCDLDITEKVQTCTQKLLALSALFTQYEATASSWLAYVLIVACLSPQVSYLEKKVTELENDSLANNDLKSKLKQETTQLVHR